MAFVKSENCHTISYRSLIFSSRRGMLQNTIYPYVFYMSVVVEYNVTVKVDNIGAILLSDNTSVSRRMKHIYVCHHFIHDYIEDRTVKIVFFGSEENLADPFTKNLINGKFHLITAVYLYC